MGEFIEEAELVTYLANDDIKLVARRVVRTWQFWGAFLLGIVTVIPAGLFAIAKYWIEPRMEEVVATYQSNTVQRLTNRVEMSVRAMESEASNRLARLDDSFRILDTNVHAKLDIAFQDVTNRIAIGFQDSKIRRTITDVASLYSKELMEHQIAPLVARFTNDLAVFRTTAETNIAELRETAGFGLTLTKAANDDRRAFDELVKLRETGPMERRMLSHTVVSQIVRKLSYEAQDRNKMMNVWEGTTNSGATATLEHYKDRYRTVEPLVRMFLVHDFYTHEKYPIYDRLGFLMEVAKNDPSLQCAYQALYCIDQEAKLGYTFLGLPLYSEWWEKNKTSYVGK